MVRVTSAEPGESVAAVLLRQAEVWSRLNPASLKRRAPYCMMGVCFECLAEVDGVVGVQTCLKPVCDGMQVVRQLGSTENWLVSGFDLLIVGAGPAGMAARRWPPGVLVLTVPSDR